MSTETEIKFKIAIGDNAREADIPPITYACVESATIKDIEKFQIPLLNRYKGAEIEVYLSAGHCDIVAASLKAHRRQGLTRSDPEFSFDACLDTILNQYTNLIINLRSEKNATLKLYMLRDPFSYTPICSGLRPLNSYYIDGVTRLNDYIKGWASKLNFATILS